MSLVALKYATYAFTASWLPSKRPGTGPETSELLPIVIVLSVMPVWFLNPLHEPALVLPVAALSPVPSVPPPEPPPVAVVDPPSVAVVPPPPVEPGTDPSGPVAVDPSAPTTWPSELTVVPFTWATVSGSSCEPQAASESATSTPTDATAARENGTTGPSTQI